ncbi:threonine/serine dehydratase [Gemmatimonadota bacterium]
MIDLFEEVQQAERRIRDHVRTTPLEFAPSLSEVSARDVYLKLENLQHTGSFKVRGAFNKLLTLSGEEAGAGVVTASSGNHGLAVAFALEKLGIPGVVFLPEDVASVKRSKLTAFPVSLEFRRGDAAEIEAAARAYGAEHGLVYVSPYNDPRVIGGQGTIGLELLAGNEEMDCVFVSVGGGGLISGIAAYLKEVRPDMLVVGCEPANSPAMSESVKAGQIVEVEITDTLSDGTAGGIEPGSITLEPCSQLVDEWVTVSESEIVEGLRWVFDHHRMIVEGSAGVVVAAYHRKMADLSCSSVALVLCGSNIDRATFMNLLS